MHFTFRLMALALVLGAGLARPADNPPFGLERLVPWTNSRVVGSPDPPLPYTVEAAFTNLTWERPLYLIPEPVRDSLLVVLQGGEPGRPSRVLRLRDDLAADQTEAFLEMEGRLIYGLTFHPGYPTNGHLYLFSNGPTSARARTNRISRFTVDRAAPQACDLATEKPILEWPSSGHDGGDLVFGPDGMLYITTGDGTSDSDGLVTGQDLTDLAGGVLRLDVDHAADGQAYVIPPGNPFLNLPGARPELWAYGLRNPWRMTVDKMTGHLWVGNNGQDLWETAHLIRRGENYGWSVYEGSHPFYLNRPPGPTPPVPPTIEHSHAEFRSLTGGAVYYGEMFPELNGVYVYGDYSTGRIWGGRHDGTRLVWHRELAKTVLQIVAFAVNPRGQLFIVDLGGSIHRLINAPPEPDRPPFPVRLSETGLFVDVRKHRPDPGLIPYSVNAPGWVDGAEVERFMGLPGEAQIGFTGSGPWDFPEGTVLAQTISLTRGGRRHRLETRLLTLQQGQWAAYSYRWNEEETDALLTPAEGQTLQWGEPGSTDGSGEARRVWRIPSRAECLACHSRAANYVLGLSTPQMNRDHAYVQTRDNQLRTLAHIGLFKNPPRQPASQLSRLADPRDKAEDVEARVRAYLHANCSVCHVEAGGGNSRMDLRFDTDRDRLGLLETRPQHATFGVDNAMLIAPGHPERSVLYQRLSRRGPGQMPPLVSSRVDEDAVQLFREWIEGLTSRTQFVKDWTIDELRPQAGEMESGRSFDLGQAAFRETGCVQCHRLAGEGGSVGPALDGAGRRLGMDGLLESIMEPSKIIAPEYAATEIETISGELLTGRVEREDEGIVLLRPLGAFGDPVTVPKKDILRRRLSTMSNMPVGVVNSLERRQILDLLHFLMTDGQPPP